MTPDDAAAEHVDWPLAGRAGKGVDSVLPHLRKQQQQQPQPPDPESRPPLGEENDSS